MYFSAHYNSVDPPPVYTPKPRDFCVAKSDRDFSWCRARVIRLIGKSSDVFNSRAMSKILKDTTKFKRYWSMMVQ